MRALVVALLLLAGCATTKPAQPSHIQIAPGIDLILGDAPAKPQVPMVAMIVLATDAHTGLIVNGAAFPYTTEAECEDARDDRTPDNSPLFHFMSVCISPTGLSL